MIKVIGVMYGKSILANTKYNTFNFVVRPTMTFALEAGKTTKKHEMQLEVAEPCLRQPLMIPFRKAQSTSLLHLI